MKKTAFFDRSYRVAKELKFYVVDAYKVAHNTGMGARINMVMQTCFFTISGILPEDEAIGYIQDTIRKTYGRKGEQIVQMNFDAVDQAVQHLYEVAAPSEVTSEIPMLPPVPQDAPEFVQR